MVLLRDRELGKYVHYISEQKETECSDCLCLRLMSFLLYTKTVPSFRRTRMMEQDKGNYKSSESTLIESLSFEASVEAAGLELLASAWGTAVVSLSPCGEPQMVVVPSLSLMLVSALWLPSPVDRNELVVLFVRIVAAEAVSPWIRPSVDGS